MRRDELVARVADVTGLANQDAAAMLAAFLDEIHSALLRGEPVQIIGFGTFATKHRKARVGRNVFTGEPVQVPALEAVSFKPSRLLKQDVRKAAKKWRTNIRRAARG